MKTFHRQKMTKSIVVLIGILIMCSGGILYMMIREVQYSFSYALSDTEMVEPRSIALVLGAGLKRHQPNEMLQNRLETALELYKNKKVKKLILTGDNRSIDYNEPMVMKGYLLAKGVPEGDLILDFAGRRTYDSCYRAKEIFDVSRIIIVTQQYHLPRSLYLCNKLGVDAIGVPSEGYGDQSQIREFGASIRAWFDINLIKGKPVLGKKEPIF